MGTKSECKQQTKSKLDVRKAVSLFEGSFHAFKAAYSV